MNLARSFAGERSMDSKTYQDWNFGFWGGGVVCWGLRVRGFRASGFVCVVLD